MKKTGKLIKLFIMTMAALYIIPCMASAAGTAKLTIEYYGEYATELDSPALTISPESGWEQFDMYSLMDYLYGNISVYSDTTTYNDDNDFSNFYFSTDGTVSGINLGYLSEGGTAKNYFSSNVESWSSDWWGALAENAWYESGIKESGIKFYIDVDGTLYSGEYDMNSIEVKPWSLITIYISDSDSVPDPARPDCTHKNTENRYTSLNNKSHTVTTICTDCGKILVEYTDSCSDGKPVYDRNTCTKTYTCKCGYSWKDFQTANGEITYDTSAKTITVNVKKIDKKNDIYTYIAKYDSDGNLIDISKNKLTTKTTTFPFSTNQTAFVWYGNSLKPFCDSFRLALK